MWNFKSNSTTLVTVFFIFSITALKKTWYHVGKKKGYICKRKIKLDFIPIFSFSLHVIVFYKNISLQTWNTTRSKERQPTSYNEKQVGSFSKTLEEFFWTLNVPYILFPWLTGFIQTEFEFNGDTIVQHTLAVKPSGSGSPLLNSVASEVRCICCGVSFKIITKIESVIWLQIRLDWSSVKNWVCERLKLTSRTRPRHWASLCSRLRILWFKLHMLWPGWQKPVKFCDIVNLNWARSFLFPPTEHLSAQFLPNWEKMQLWRFLIQLDLISVHVVTSCLTQKHTHIHTLLYLFKEQRQKLTLEVRNVNPLGTDWELSPTMIYSK